MYQTETKQQLSYYFVIVLFLFLFLFACFLFVCLFFAVVVFLLFFFFCCCFFFLDFVVVVVVVVSVHVCFYGIVLFYVFKKIDLQLLKVRLYDTLLLGNRDSAPIKCCFRSKTISLNSDFCSQHNFTHQAHIFV